MTDSLAPGFLIAVPHMVDPNFHQTVVLLLRQGEEGALGMVINRETRLRLGDLCREHSIPYAGDPEKLVRAGGPVQPEQGFVLLGPEHQDPEAVQVQEGLLFSASTQTLSRLCREGCRRFHCYAGYAGWGPGQLEREIGDGAWIIGPADPLLILDTPVEIIWGAALRENGIDPAAIVPGGGES
jgi:putative transcriptional regulator